MRANRTKAAIFRKTADDLERQAMAGVEVNVLLTPAQVCGSSAGGEWWVRGNTMQATPPNQ
jgi:hypothetical protein